MNRHTRRATAKNPKPAPVTPAASIEPAPVYGKPGLVLRIFAKVLLSQWVLKRVNHPDLRRVLASMAVQAGRPDVYEILRRP